MWPQVWSSKKRMALITLQKDDLQYLHDPEISAPHGFTTRLGGVSKDHLASLNLGANRGDARENVEQNYQILATALNFDLDKLVLAHQIHSDIVRVVTKADAKGIDHRTYPECDALITNDPGVTLGVFTADCTPILYHDPVTGAVGAVHAGWRGTAAGIAGKTVQKMVAVFGCTPRDIRCAIGPNIGACCFETDRDVPEAMIAALGDSALPYIAAKGDKFHLDLKQINALFLRRAGVERITVSTDCTMCQWERFWSHRKTGGLRGSQGAFIKREEERR